MTMFRPTVACRRPWKFCAVLAAVEPAAPNVSTAPGHFPLCWFVRHRPLHRSLCCVAVAAVVLGVALDFGERRAVGDNERPRILGPTSPPDGFDLVSGFCVAIHRDHSTRARSFEWHSSCPHSVAAFESGLAFAEDY